MGNIIQQLLDLKEWGQDPTRYERRMNFRGGQLVQPGVEGVRQGYAEPLESTGIQLNQTQKNYLKKNLSSKQWSKLDFNRPLKADAINYGIVQRTADGGKNPLYRRVKLLLEHQAMPPGKRPVPGSLYTVGERNKINTIIKTQLKKKEIPSRANIADLANVSEDYVERYVIETKGQKFHNKHFSYVEGKMKSGNLKQQQALFEFVNSTDNISAAKIAKNFKITRPQANSLIGDLLGSIYTQRGGEYAEKSLFLPKDIDVLRNVTSKIRNADDFVDIYERSIGTLIRDAYGGDRQGLNRANKALGEYWKLSRALREKFPQLALHLDHVVPFEFLSLVDQGVNPMSLIRVRPIPAAVNRFKANFDNSRIKIAKELLANPNSKSALAKYNALKNLEKVAPIEFGGISKKGHIYNYKAQAFGKGDLLADIKNAPKLYEDVYKFAQDVLKKPEWQKWAKASGVSEDLRMFEKFKKPEFAANPKLIEEITKKLKIKLGNKVTNKQAGFIAADMLKDFGKLGLKGAKLLRWLQLEWEAAFEGLMYQYAKKYKGYDHDLAREELFLPKLIAKLAPDLWKKAGFKPFKTGFMEGADPLIEEQLIGTRWDPSGKTNLVADYADRLTNYQKEVDKYNKLDFELDMMTSNKLRTPTPPEKIEAKKKELADQRELIIGLESTLKPGTPAYEAYMRAKEKEDHKFGMGKFESKAESAKTREKRLHDEYLEYKGGKDRSFYLPKGKLNLRVEDPLHKKPYTFLKTEDTVRDMVNPSKEDWEYYGLTDTQVGPVIQEGVKEKWETIYDMGGIDLMDRIGIAGGVANMAEGGIMNLKKKW